MVVGTEEGVGGDGQLVLHERRALMIYRRGRE